MTEDSAPISNEINGNSAGPVIQVGVVHGNLTVRTHPSPRQPESTLLVSVTAKYQETTTYRYDGAGGDSRHDAHVNPVYEVHVLVEAFTAQAVILHRLRPVVVRRITGPVTGSHAAMLGRREFQVGLDVPEPTLFDAGLDKQALQLDQARSARKTDFPLYVTASEPEYLVVWPAGSGLIEWQMELDWSSLGQRGTVVLDNGGTPFLFAPGTAFRAAPR